MSAPCWVVFYHYVRPAGASGHGIRALRPDEFAAQLDWLAERAAIIGYDEFAAAVAARRAFARPSVLLTFDDGLADHREFAAAELTRRGWSGVFFVNGDPLEEPPRLVNVHRSHLLLDALGPAALLDEVRRQIATDVAAGAFDADGLYRYDGEPAQVVKRLLNYELPYAELDRVLAELVACHLGDENELARRFYLSPADIRTLADGGMTFGYHTRRHRVLSRLDRAGQHDELAGGVERIRALTGQSSIPFCYPYGHRQTFNADTIALLQSCGFALAFTTARQPAWPRDNDRFAIPRYDAVDFPPRGAAPLGITQELHP